MESVKRVPVVQQVVEKIKEYLFSGEVSVGDKLPVEKELCEQLEVGRGTVREALRMLEATGYVESRPGKGTLPQGLLKWNWATLCSGSQNMR